MPADSLNNGRGPAAVPAAAPSIAAAAPGRHEVLFLSPGGLGQRGGMGSVVRTLVAGWPAADDPLRLVVVDPWPHEWKLGFAPGSLVGLLAALSTVLRSGLAGRLAIVHLHMAGGGSVPRKGLFIWLGRALGARVVVHSAAADLDSLWARLPGLGRWLVRQTLRRADAVVALGAYWQGFFRDRVGLDAERVVVIPNGVADPGPPAARPVSGTCRLLFVGRLGERKGTPVLLDALADPTMASLDWSLTLAGDGDVAGMTARAERLGIAGRCRFTGWVAAAAVGALMREADILVLPSYQEGLPMAILEGMAHGLAIVSTRAGAIGDAVSDGENGLLTPPGDTAALTLALRALIVDPERRRDCQVAARRRFSADFADKIMVDRFRALYRRLSPLPAAATIDRPGL